MPTNEPVMWTTMAMSALRAVLAWCLTMGFFSLSPDQLEASIGMAATVFLLLDAGAAWYARRQVTPNVKVEAKVDAAVRVAEHAAQLDARNQIRPD